MEARLGNYPLQNKLRSTMDKLRSEGVFAGFQEDEDLSRRLGGFRNYTADFLARTASGKLFDIETDHPYQHPRKKDLERDEAIVVLAGISTIRVSGMEIDAGEAEAKIRELVAEVERTGRPLQAGSTRKRRLRKRGRRLYGAPNVAIYVNVCHRGRGWGWAARACEHVFEHGIWVPGETLAETSGMIAAPGATKESVTLAALDDERLWDEAPLGCNLCIYAHGVDVASAAGRYDTPVEELLADRTVVYSQKVSQRQYADEAGEASNFAVLHELEPVALAHAVEASRSAPGEAVPSA